LNSGEKEKHCIDSLPSLLSAFVRIPFSTLFSRSSESLRFISFVSVQKKEKGKEKKE
jgi:hypothetical protein